ncbi:MAG: hypothetical protein AVDCRST_MAG08-2118, partial [uncultured Acetobacteraceae bacterium]
GRQASRPPGCAQRGDGDAGATCPGGDAGDPSPRGLRRGQRALPAGGLPAARHPGRRRRPHALADRPGAGPHHPGLRRAAHGAERVLPRRAARPQHRGDADPDLRGGARPGRRRRAGGGAALVHRRGGAGRGGLAAAELHRAAGLQPGRDPRGGRGRAGALVLAGGRRTAGHGLPHLRVLRADAGGGGGEPAARAAV